MIGMKIGKIVLLSILYLCIFTNNYLLSNNTIYIMGPAPHREAFFCSTQYGKAGNCWKREGERLFDKLKSEYSKDGKNISFFPVPAYLEWYDMRKWKESWNRYGKRELRDMYQRSLEGLAVDLATKIADMYKDSLKVFFDPRLVGSVKWTRINLVSYGWGYFVMAKAIEELSYKKDGIKLLSVILGNLIAFESPGEEDKIPSFPGDDPVDFWDNIVNPIEWARRKRLSARKELAANLWQQRKGEGSSQAMVQDTGAGAAAGPVTVAALLEGTASPEELEVDDTSSEISEADSYNVKILNEILGRIQLYRILDWEGGIGVSGKGCCYR